jgi:hypothetical protein
VKNISQVLFAAILSLAVSQVALANDPEKVPVNKVQKVEKLKHKAAKMKKRAEKLEQKAAKLEGKAVASPETSNK